LVCHVVPFSFCHPTYTRLGIIPLNELVKTQISLCVFASPTAQVEEYLKEVNKGHDDGAILLDDADISLGDFSFPGDNVSQDANTSSGASDPAMVFDMPNFTSQDAGAFINSQLMGLGMSEALPPYEMIEEL
jgi:hypothetical protein